MLAFPCLSFPRAMRGISWERNKGKPGLDYKDVSFFNHNYRRIIFLEWARETSERTSIIMVEEGNIPLSIIVRAVTKRQTPIRLRLSTESYCVCLLVTYGPVYDYRQGNSRKNDYNERLRVTRRNTVIIVRRPLPLSFLQSFQSSFREFPSDLPLGKIQT